MQSIRALVAAAAQLQPQGAINVAAPLPGMRLLHALAFSGALQHCAPARAWPRLWSSSASSSSREPAHGQQLHQQGLGPALRGGEGAADEGAHAGSSGRAAAAAGAAAPASAGGRHATAATTSLPSQQQQHQGVLRGHHRPQHPPLQPEHQQRAWDWGWVAASATQRGNQRSRKPAIRKPARHQWHFCDPTYSPHEPLPPKALTPFTPPTNLRQDEWQLFRAQQAHSRQASPARYRAQFVRWLALRDLDWRTAFQQGVAEDAKQRGRELRRVKHARRHEAWRAFVAGQGLPAAAGR